MLRPGKLEASKITNEPSQLHRYVRPRAGVDRSYRQTITDNDRLPSEEEKRDCQIPPQNMPDDDKTPPRKEEGDCRATPRDIPDNDTFLSEN